MRAAVIADAPPRFPGVPIRLVPALAVEPRGAAALAEIGRLLLGRRRRAGAGPRARGHRAVAAGQSRSSPLAPAAARPSRGGADWLDALAPPGVRLLLFAGKGGVGKTTTAAAVALALAEREPASRVVLLSNDPAHSLGDVLAAPLDDVARPVPGAPPGLCGARDRRRRAVRGAARRYLDAVDRVFAGCAASRGFDIAFDRAVVEELVDLAPPGIDELLGLLAIVDAGRRVRPGRRADRGRRHGADGPPAAAPRHAAARPRNGCTR